MALLLCVSGLAIFLTGVSGLLQWIPMFDGGIAQSIENHDETKVASVRWSDGGAITPRLHSVHVAMTWAPASTTQVLVVDSAFPPKIRWARPDLLHVELIRPWKSLHRPRHIEVGGRRLRVEIARD